MIYATSFTYNFSCTLQVIYYGLAVHFIFIAFCKTTAIRATQELFATIIQINPLFTLGGNLPQLSGQTKPVARNLTRIYQNTICTLESPVLSNGNDLFLTLLSVSATDLGFNVISSSYIKVTVWEEPVWKSEPIKSILTRMVIHIEKSRKRNAKVLNLDGWSELYVQ